MDFPALRSLDAAEFPNNLPLQVTSFVGRESEMAEVKRLLLSTRLLTLVGPGGCGKSRLTLQVAADVLEQYPDGVWLAELAPLANPALVPERVAAVLGVQPQSEKSLSSVLVEALKHRKLLLLLDNCEHLIDACAELADVLIRSCPGLVILGSSREALGIAGETAYRIPSLRTPEQPEDATPESLSQYEAVRLFVERAAAVLPTFAVTSQNAPAVAQVCYRLDGIPLALELAAARVQALPVEQIARRLDDMFRLLTGGSRTALPRQQTLRALIDWSYDLLQEPEKALLLRLSVFAGSWGLEMAEQVCSGNGIEDGEVLDLLTSLVGKSLVLYEEQYGEARYRLPETVRQYARERLMDTGEGDLVRNRHLEFCVQHAESTAAAGQEGYMDRIASNNDNLRAALEWATADEARAELALRLCIALRLFWVMGLYYREGREWLQRALAVGAAASPPLRSRALVAAGDLALFDGSLDAANNLLDESVKLARAASDPDLLADALHSMGRVVRDRVHDFVAAGALFEEARNLSRETGDRAAEGWAAGELGLIAQHLKSYSLAQRLHEESLALFRSAGDRVGQGWALQDLGEVLASQGNIAGSRALVEQSLALRRELGDAKGIWGATVMLANLAEMEHDLPAASAHLKTLLEIQGPARDARERVRGLWRMGRVLRQQGDLAGAESALKEAIALSRTDEGRNRMLHNCLIELGHVYLNRDDYEGAHSCYEQGLQLREVAGDRFLVSFTLLEIGHVSWLQQDYKAAADTIYRAVDLAREFDDIELLLNALESLGGLASGRGQAARAATLLGAAEALRETPGQPVSSFWTEPQDRILKATSHLRETESAAWAEGRTMTLEQAIECALGGIDDWSNTSSDERT